MDERHHGCRHHFSIYNEPNRIHLSNKSVNLMPHQYAKHNQFYKTILHILDKEKSNTHYTTFN